MTRVLALAAAAVHAGCASKDRAPTAGPLSLGLESPARTTPRHDTERRIEPGDELEIEFPPAPTRPPPPVASRPAETTSEAARHRTLRRGERLALRFAFDPEYNQELVIADDGRVRPLLLGPVAAEGMTHDELARRLQDSYARYLRDPDLTLTADDPSPAAPRSAAATDGSAQAASSTNAPADTMPASPARAGMLLRVTVAADGFIDVLPPGRIRAAGQTPIGLEVLLAAALRGVGPDAGRVRVAVRRHAHPRVWVTGEVARPGAIVADRPLTISELLTAAGGLTEAADAGRVLIVSRDGMNPPRIELVDVRHAAGARRRLAEGESIHVPRGS